MSPEYEAKIRKYMQTAIEEAMTIMVVEARKKGFTGPSVREITKVMIDSMFETAIASTAGWALAENIDASWKDAANTAFREAFLKCEAKVEKSTTSIRKEEKNNKS